jgi:hypothetical protein
MLIDVDYVVTQEDVKYKDKDVVAAIEILKGDFASVKFYFGELNFAEEENSDGSFLISFNYDIIDEEDAWLRGKEEFEVVISDILNNLLRNSLDMAQQRYDNESRKENSETHPE